MLKEIDSHYLTNEDTTALKALDTQIANSKDKNEIQDLIEARKRFEDEAELNEYQTDLSYCDTWRNRVFESMTEEERAQYDNLAGKEKEKFFLSCDCRYTQACMLQEIENHIMLYSIDFQKIHRILADFRKNGDKNAPDYAQRLEYLEYASGIVEANLKDSLKMHLLFNDQDAYEAYVSRRTTPIFVYIGDDGTVNIPDNEPYGQHQDDDADEFIRSIMA